MLELLVCVCMCTLEQHLYAFNKKQSMKKIRSWTFRSRFEFVFPVFLLAQAIRFVVGGLCFFFFLLYSGRVGWDVMEVQSVVLDDVGVMPKCGAGYQKGTI